jgi:RNA polymerase sigma-70 factor (ECF subfamily)
MEEAVGGDLGERSERCEPLAMALIEELYRSRRGAMERWLTGMTRDPEVAADAVQEAFVRLIEETAAGRAPDAQEAWVRRVAYNVFISGVRRERVVERRGPALDSAREADSAESRAIEREEGRLVAEALSDLEERDRAALLMAAGGYRGLEIARFLGSTEGAARTRLCRARARLRLGMEPAPHAA